MYKQFKSHIATPDTTTTYSVNISTIDNFGDTCSKKLTTTVYGINPSLYSIFATVTDDTLVQEQATIVHAITDTTLDVNWRPPLSGNTSNSFNIAVSPDSTTIYTVSVLDATGCPKMALVTVYVIPNKCGESGVFVPNTFTPNGDGNNDILYVRGKEIKQLYFAVYNRRGELVFETTKISHGWDGIYKGMKADPDVFGWYLNAKCFNGDDFTSKGNVTLIR